MGAFSVGEVAKMFEDEYGRRVYPHVISGLFYQGVLDSNICPVRFGRRSIPETYVPQIEMALKRRGKIPWRARSK